VLSPEAVSALHEAKYPQGVHVVAQGHSIAQDETLSCLDVGPGGFLREEVGKENLSAVVIDRGNQGPLFVGKRGPPVGEASCCTKDLSVARFSLASRVMAAEFFGSLDDGSHRDLDAFLSQAVSQCRVVVVRNGQLWVLHDLSFLQQCMFYLTLCLGSESRRGSPHVGKGECVGVLPI